MALWMSCWTGVLGYSRTWRKISGAHIASNIVCLSFPFFLAEILKVLTHAFLVLEHGSEKHQEIALSHLLTCLLDLATNEQGFKSVTKALKEGGKDALDKFVRRMREPPMGWARLESYISVDYRLADLACSCLQRPSSYHRRPCTFSHWQPTCSKHPTKCTSPHYPIERISNAKLDW